MDRLHREYIKAAKSLGVSLKVFAGQERSIRKQLGGADLLILCTGKVSHSARQEVVTHASVKKIPLFMIHSSGVSSLRGCIENCCLGGSEAPCLCGSCPNQAINADKA
jgi:ABC-type uncharacterized transport system substrate-binding protein